MLPTSENNFLPELKITKDRLKCQDIFDYFSCNLCKKLLSLNSCVQCKKCAEHFCKDCLKEFFTNNKGKCPSGCDNFDGISLTPKRLSQIQVSCRFENCKEFFEYEKLNEHEKLCPKKEVMCPACQVNFSLNDYDRHINFCSADKFQAECHKCGFKGNLRNSYYHCCDLVNITKTEHENIISLNSDFRTEINDKMTFFHYHINKSILQTELKQSVFQDEQKKLNEDLKLKLNELFKIINRKSTEKPQIAEPKKEIKKAPEEPKISSSSNMKKNKLLGKKTARDNKDTIKTSLSESNILKLKKEVDDNSSFSQSSSKIQQKDHKRKKSPANKKVISLKNKISRDDRVEIKCKVNVSYLLVKSYTELVIASDLGDLFLFEIDLNDRLFLEKLTYKNIHMDRILCLIETTNKKGFISCCCNSMIFLWDYNESNFKMAFECMSSPFMNFKMEINEQLLIGAEVYSKTLSIWEISSGKSLVKFDDTFDSQITSLLLFKEDIVLTGSINRSKLCIQIDEWNLSTGKVEYFLTDSPSNKKIFIASNNKSNEMLVSLQKYNSDYFLTCTLHGHINLVSYSDKTKLFIFNNNKPIKHISSILDNRFFIAKYNYTYMIELPNLEELIIQNSKGSSKQGDGQENVKRIFTSLYNDVLLYLNESRILSYRGKENNVVVIYKIKN